MRGIVLVLVASACGRIGFDASGDAGSAADALAATDATPVAGLVAWWKLDEGSGTTAHDSVGTTDGTLTGTGLAWTTQGKFGGAVAFSGNGDDVVLGAPTRLDNLPAVTLGVWLRPSSIVSPGSCYFDKGSSGPPAGGWYASVSRNSAGDLSFGAFFGVNDEVFRTSSPGYLQVDTWAHVVVTWDGTSIATGIHIYVDGVEVTYADANNAIGTTHLDDSGIGAAIGCIASSSFAGIEDDVKVFDRVLAPAEITQL